MSEAAKLLRLSKTGAYAAAKCGAIPTVRIGGKILVPLAAIERMLDVAIDEARK